MGALAIALALALTLILVVAEKGTSAPAPAIALAGGAEGVGNALSSKDIDGMTEESKAAEASADGQPIAGNGGAPEEENINRMLATL